MKNYAFFIGVDISKETLDFALIVQNVILFHLQVTNDKLGIELFIKQVRKHDKSFSFENSLFCMEHTARAAPWNLQQSTSKLFTSKTGECVARTSNPNQGEHGRFS